MEEKTAGKKRWQVGAVVEAKEKQTWLEVEWEVEKG